MIRLFAIVKLAALLVFFALTACAPAGRQLMGNPENPYPLKRQPKIGEIVHLPTGVVVSAPQMLSIAGDARVVYVGETHDNPASHRLELQLLQGLSDLHPGKQALGMEMFVRSQQPALDRWVAGKLDEKGFLRESHWYENWKMDFAYYRDLLNFARERHIPIIALNAEKKMVEAIRSKTPDQLSPEERAQLPELDFSDPYQRGMVAGIFGGHSYGKLMLDGFVRAQTLWDETMAESVAKYLEAPAGKEMHMLVVAGGNHISYGFGIPRRVFRRLPSSYVLVGGDEIKVSAEKQKEMMDVNLPEFPMVPYDFVNYFAYETLPKTGVTLGVMIEPSPSGSGLVIKGVMPGSNAARAGLQEGDLLLSMDGEPLKDNLDLVYAVQQKHAGDQSKLQVKRKEQAMDVNVVFQPDSQDHAHGK